MLTTFELRWFYSGNVPEVVDCWFQQNCPGEQLGQPEARKDLYLHSPECEYLGIKLRQGKLEIKWRKTELGVLHFAERLIGKAEKWAKWICEDPTEETFLPIDVLGKPWVSVHKVRSQRQYQGCHVELTQLNVENDTWWSLGFEASVECISSMDNFQLVTTHLLKTYPDSYLLTEDSYAYPKWLSLVA